MYTVDLHVKVTNSSLQSFVDDTQIIKTTGISNDYSNIVTVDVPDFCPEGIFGCCTVTKVF